MALVQDPRLVKGPDEGHFALLLNDGARGAIPPGASLWLVEDYTQPEKIYPLTLKKVSVKKIVFEMIQADGSRTEYVYQLTSAKPLNKKALENLVKNRQGLPTKTQK